MWSNGLSWVKGGGKQYPSFLLANQHMNSQWGARNQIRDTAPTPFFYSWHDLYYVEMCTFDFIMCLYSISVLLFFIQYFFLMIQCVHICIHKHVTVYLLFYLIVAMCFIYNPNLSPYFNLQPVMEAYDSLNHCLILTISWQ